MRFEADAHFWSDFCRTSSCSGGNAGWLRDPLAEPASEDRPPERPPEPPPEPPPMPAPASRSCSAVRG